jgi:hypothetical protein
MNSNMGPAESAPAGKKIYRDCGKLQWLHHKLSASHPKMPTSGLGAICCETTS